MERALECEMGKTTGRERNAKSERVVQYVRYC